MSEKIVQLNEEIIKGQLKELVRGSVEETLNELLEKEAESLTQAARYERNEARQGYRSGHYDRNLTTTSGDVTLHVPRLKGVSFETAIIERYRRRESSVEAVSYTHLDQYVHTDTGANGLAKYLATHGIHKIQRQNGKNPLFDAALIRRILKNPVYCGKIAYGRRRTEKVHGTRNDYRLVEQDDYLLVDGLHEGIVSEELWHEAQVKLLAQAEKYEHVNRGKDTKIHLLSGIVKCPVCGVGMYGNKSIKHKAVSYTHHLV